MPDDCAGEQTCSGGFCVSSSDVQCMSTPSATNDAGVGGSVGGYADAGIDAPPDAPTHGLLTVDIAGKGYVDLEGIGICDSDGPEEGHCQFQAPLVLAVTVRAVADDDWYFDRWTTIACASASGDTCVFLPTITMELGAKFRKDD